LSERRARKIPRPTGPVAPVRRNGNFGCLLIHEGRIA